MATPELAAAQSAELVWQEDKKHKGWTVHLHIGAEVIKYPHPDAGHDKTDADLVAMAVEDAKNDGYELNPAQVKVKR